MLFKLLQLEKDDEIVVFEEWKEEQEERKKTVLRSCVSLGWLEFNLSKAAKLIHRPGSYEWSGSFLGHDPYDVINCNIPKVASTSIKTAMNNITGDAQLPDLKNDYHYQYHQWKYLQSSGLVDLCNEPLEDIERRLSNHTKFIVVRHPLKRILSAFKDKLASRDGARMPELVKPVFDFHQRRNEHPRTANVSFGEFVDFLLATKKNNTHWRSFHKTCFPCQVD
jgi:hypothetical protein